MLAEERRQSILGLIQENGSARTVELAQRFRVSDQTIRRDLLELEEKGLISKHHGGGVLVNYQGASYRERAVSRRADKLRIAQAAVRLVTSGMTVALGPGTTTEEIARLVNGPKLQVVTNSLAVARALPNAAGEVRLVGGRYRPESELVTGPWALRTLSDIFVDISFLGVSGIGSEAGYTVTEADEAAVLRQFFRSAKKAVVVTDSSKFQRVAKESVAPLEAAHLLITDSGVPHEGLELLRERSVEVTVVNSSEEVRLPAQVA